MTRAEREFAPPACPPDLAVAVFKILETGPKTLFHGVDGTRRVGIGKWSRACNKLVTDGGGGTEYLSGWHVLPTLDGAVGYLDNFSPRRRETLEIWLCETPRKGIRGKEHSRSEVWLVDWIRLVRRLP